MANHQNCRIELFFWPSTTALMMIGGGILFVHYFDSDNCHKIKAEQKTVQFKNVEFIKSDRIVVRKKKILIRVALLRNVALGGALHEEPRYYQHEAGIFSGVRFGLQDLCCSAFGNIFTIGNKTAWDLGATLVAIGVF